MRLSDEEIAAALPALTGWSRSGDKLVKTFDRATFDGAIAFVNAVAALANARDHHPAIRVDWRRVTLELWSHDAGGITARDLALAAACDALP